MFTRAQSKPVKWVLLGLLVCKTEWKPQTYSVVTQITRHTRQHFELFEIGLIWWWCSESIFSVIEYHNRRVNKATHHFLYSLSCVVMNIKAAWYFSKKRTILLTGFPLKVAHWVKVKLLKRKGKIVRERGLNQKLFTFLLSFGLDIWVLMGGYFWETCYTQSFVKRKVTR